MDLYYEKGSPPCASVLMVAAALNLQLNKLYVDLEKKEHLTPDFLKLNPQHTVPTLVDNGFVIWESRAICLYLLEKYGKDSSLYPKDPQIRAVIHQRLFFDFTLYDRYGLYYYAFWYGKEPKPEDLTKFEENVELLDKLLAGNEFFAGTKTLSVADILLFSTVGCFKPVGFDVSRYPNVSKWFAKVSQIVPGKEISAEFVRAFSEFMPQQE